jgi:hypothetical protein
MQLRRQKQLLAFLVLVMLCAAVTAVGWPFFVPVDVVSGNSKASTKVQQEPVKPASTAREEDFAQVWSKQLQRPLVDPVIEAPVQKTVELPRVAKPNWKLLGVFWKQAAPESSLATFQTGPKPSDRKYVTVGDTLLNAKVNRMDESTVVVSLEGQEFVFELSGE